MKKILMFFMVALLVFSLSGQAMAYFEDEHLIRVVYNRGGTYEIVTDLGGGWNFTTQSTTVDHLFNTNNFSLTSLGLSSWNTVYVAYFIADINSNVWTSGVGGQKSMTNQFDPFTGKAHYITGANSLTGNAQNVNLQSGPNSYKNRFLTTGRFGGFLSPLTNTGDAHLGSLDTAAYVDQFLYYYGDPDEARLGTQVYNIRTYANGTTELNGVPIPGAVYLLGSGLLSLIGIRRRMTA